MGRSRRGKVKWYKQFALHGAGMQAQCYRPHPNERNERHAGRGSSDRQLTLQSEGRGKSHSGQGTVHAPRKGLSPSCRGRQEGLSVPRAGDDL